MIYEPREDSLLLQKHVKTHAQGNVLDMGTGSGIQALTALENTKDVLAVDINEEAVKLVKKKGVKSITSDLFSNVKGTFDVIMFNPPYLPQEERESFEDRVALTGGKYGWEIIDRFLAQAKNHLSKEGKILLVFSTITGDVEFIASKYGYTCEKLDEESFFFERIYVYALTQ